MKGFFMALSIMLSLCSCGSHKATSEVTNGTGSEENAQETLPPMVPQKIVGGGVAALPKAVIYKTVADFSNNVPIMLATDGSVVSYPGPTDIFDAKRPLKLADGYLLDRCGIGLGVAYTSYSFADYSALSEVPTVDVLKSKIVNSDPIVEMYILPITLEDAKSNLDRVNSYIKNGFNGCERLK